MGAEPEAEVGSSESAPGDAAASALGSTGSVHLPLYITHGPHGGTSSSCSPLATAPFTAAGMSGIAQLGTLIVHVNNPGPGDACQKTKD